ncbi:hypothetical protein SpCBS45565_g04349 [Spizellomyces sp. 'palustris']|nr:hypothetical protein SpCBS45565_g04349 [Spizellomyces sp. 'palustris']
MSHMQRHPPGAPVDRQMGRYVYVDAGHTIHPMGIPRFPPPASDMPSVFPPIPPPQTFAWDAPSSHFNESIGWPTDPFIRYPESERWDARPFPERRISQSNSDIWDGRHLREGYLRGEPPKGDRRSSAGGSFRDGVRRASLHDMRDQPDRQPPGSFSRFPENHRDPPANYFDPPSVRGAKDYERGMYPSLRRERPMDRSPTFDQHVDSLRDSNGDPLPDGHLDIRSRMTSIFNRDPDEVVRQIQQRHTLPRQSTAPSFIDLTEDEQVPTPVTTLPARSLSDGNIPDSWILANPSVSSPSEQVPDSNPPVPAASSPKNQVLETVRSADEDPNPTSPMEIDSSDTHPPAPPSFQAKKNGSHDAVISIVEAAVRSRKGTLSGLTGNGIAINPKFLRGKKRAGRTLAPAVSERDSASKRINSPRLPTIRKTSSSTSISSVASASSSTHAVDKHPWKIPATAKYAQPLPSPPAELNLEWREPQTVVENGRRERILFSDAWISPNILIPPVFPLHISSKMLHISSSWATQSRRFFRRLRRLNTKTGPAPERDTTLGTREKAGTYVYDAVDSENDEECRRTRRHSAPVPSAPSQPRNSNASSISPPTRTSSSRHHSTPSLTSTVPRHRSSSAFPNPSSPCLFANTAVFDPTPTYVSKPTELVQDLLPPSYHMFSEYRSKYLVVANVPDGMSQKDTLQVFVFDDAREVGFAGSERQMGVRVKVPDDANLRDVRASVCNGILTVTIGKSPSVDVLLR